MKFSRDYKKWIVWLAIVLSITCLIFGARNQEIKKPKTLNINGITLNIEVANADAEKTKGLSGKSGLADNEGMLFVFEKEGNHGFWMKDMNFPIDIAWLNKNKLIIHIEKDVLPETYPKVFSPSAPSLYVLEAKANFFENNKIKIGDAAEF
jgi:uncharacterized protein